jgi:Icc-related predicted phosphoesterase
MKIFITVLLFIVISPAFALKVAVISDMNSSYGSTKYNSAVDITVKQLLKEKPDLVISTGDMIAGQKRGLDYLSMWDSFHKKVTLPFKNAGIPFAVTPGNHDGSLAIKFKLEREIYKAQWTEYKTDLDYIHSENYPNYYAFVLNNILFVSLDATLVAPLGNNQREWLKKVLTEKISYKHKIVFGHLPVFPTVAKKASEILLEQGLDELFNKTNVSAYLSGHHHAYYPGKIGNTRHISQGCLGSGPRKLIGMSQRSTRSYTILNLDNKISVDAYDVENNFKLINKKELPESILKLKRDDLHP